MFKNPLSKTGSIRYFELFKIAVVILTFFAWGSYLSELRETYLVSVQLILFIESMVLIALTLLVLNECNRIIALVKAFKVRIQSYRVTYRFIRSIIHVQAVITLYRQRLFFTFDVLRC